MRPAQSQASPRPEVGVSLTTASRELADRHPQIARLYQLHGPCRLGRRVRIQERFGQLARSVVYQQLAGSAARAIWGRLLEALGGECAPESILAADPGLLRSVGLSGSKAKTLIALAERQESGELRLEQLDRFSDAEAQQVLTQVHGIGPWTAQMFLMFSLRRLDIWPVGDLGVRKGYFLAFSLEDVPTERELLPLGERFRPYRSVAAWYCWRACDGDAPDW